MLGRDIAAMMLVGSGTMPGSARRSPCRLEVEDLRARLARTRFPDQAPGEPWAYGTDLAYLCELVGYWRQGFDWRAQEALLNAFPQCRVALGGIDLHYLYVPGRGPAPMPLLLLHGRPGSVFEFLELIPRLADPARFGGDPADAFTVVDPSLPGFGLSFAPANGASRPRSGRPAPRTDGAWSDCGGDVESVIPRDRLLANVSLYWFTGAIGSSFWPYHARLHGPWPIPEDSTVDVPTGYAAFPREILRPPRSLAAHTFTDVRRWTEMERGGHFAALEQPEALAREVTAFFRPLRAWMR